MKTEAAEVLREAVTAFQACPAVSQVQGARAEIVEMFRVANWLDVQQDFLDPVAQEAFRMAYRMAQDLPGRDPKLATPLMFKLSAFLKQPKAKSDFKVNVSIPDDMIESLLVSAFEGGSNYWLGKVGRINVAQDKKKDLYQTVLQGDGLTIKERDEEAPVIKDFGILDRKTIEAGLEKMAKDAPGHFGDIKTDNADAETGDVFLQFCLFGKIIYG